MYRKFIKRFLDILLSLLILILFCWLYLIIAILVRVKLGSPVFFTQERPGLHGKIFKVYKFRSMTDAKDEKGELLPDNIRLTAFGRALRASSLVVDYFPSNGQPLVSAYRTTPQQLAFPRHEVLSSFNAGPHQPLINFCV